MEQDKTGDTPHPKYLGVTLDRTLSYKEHMHNTKMTATSNNLLRKLSNSKWGANASTKGTTALALCYSVTEYAAPFWARSSHVAFPGTDIYIQRISLPRYTEEEQWLHNINLNANNTGPYQSLH